MIDFISRVGASVIHFIRAFGLFCFGALWLANLISVSTARF